MKKFLAIILILAAVSIAMGKTSDQACHYLEFTAEESGANIFLITEGDFEHPKLEYSYDLKKWIPYTGKPIDLKVRNKKKNAKPNVYLRGHNPKGFSTSEEDYAHIMTNGKVWASGNIMALIDGTGASKSIPCDYCFYKLFENCTSLMSAPDLPATKLRTACYKYMFDGCTSLQTACELPATIMADECYMGMYRNCKSLERMPELKATTLGEQCYREMFMGCINMVTVAKILPALVLKNSCYRDMFNGCKRIAEAPELPAQVCENFSYYHMFSNCVNLRYINMGLREWLRYRSFEWMKDVSPQGTFVCPKELDIERGESRIPEDWTVEDHDHNKRDTNFTQHLRKTANKIMDINPFAPFINDDINEANMLQDCIFYGYIPPHDYIERSLETVRGSFFMYIDSKANMPTEVIPENGNNQRFTTKDFASKNKIKSGSIKHTIRITNPGDTPQRVRITIWLPAR